MNRNWRAALEPPRKTEMPTGNPFVEWFTGLGITGKMVLFGSIIGIIAAFMTLGRGDESVRLVQDWRGVLSLLAYFAAGCLSVLLYLPGGHPQQRNMSRALLAAGVLVAVFAAWLALSNWKAGPVTLCLNLIAAGAVAIGALFKAFDERIFWRGESAENRLEADYRRGSIEVDILPQGRGDLPY
jgi:hypothetical protein